MSHTTQNTVKFIFKVAITSTILLLSCCASIFAQSIGSNSPELNILEDEKADSKVMYRNMINGHSIQLLLENTPDSSENHVVRERTAKSGSTFELIDGAQRFARGGLDPRLSKTELWWDGTKVDLPNYPNNQIFGFRYNTYGARNVAESGMDGLYFTTNRSNTAVMINLAKAIVEESTYMLFSAVMLSKSGAWQIYPPSSQAYQEPDFQKLTVLQKGGADLPGSEREVQYEGAWKKHKIKLILEVQPDEDANHKIERKIVNGKEEVLVDGVRKWYDPASPISGSLPRLKPGGMGAQSN